MSIAYFFSAYNRRRKWRYFQEFFPFGPEEKILDVGFNEIEYSATDNFLEKNYPYLRQITALGIDEPVEFRKRYPEIKALSYDGSHFPFPDNHFDLAWSNAVLEHVGNREAQVNFLRELRRVAKHGFITTPNRFFPIEIHTRTILLHFLPRSFFHAYLKLIGKGWATGSYMNLLSKRELQSILKEAEIEGYKIISNRLFGFVLDFVVIF